MEETKRFSAQNRVFDALYVLLREKPYREIKVTDLVAVAGINRATFYKHFGSTTDLFQKAQDRLCGVLLSLSVAKPKSAEGLRSFTRTLFALFLREHETQVWLLGGENGDVRTFWMIGTAIQARLQQEADALGTEDDAVRRNILGASGFFASFLCRIVYQKKLSSILSSLSPFVYRQDITFFENAALQLQQRRGGSVQFHYDLLLTYVKFYDRFEPQVPVTKLLKSAGISRTEFYLYYRNFNDFYQAYTNVMYVSASLFCLDLFKAPAKKGAEMLASFSEMNYGFVQRAMCKAIACGDIVLYITMLIGSVYTLIAQQFPVYPDPEQSVRFQLLYEIGSVVSFAMAFYSGKIDDAAMENCLQRHDALRQNLMDGGALYA